MLCTKWFPCKASPVRLPLGSEARRWLNEHYQASWPTGRLSWRAAAPIDTSVIPLLLLIMKSTELTLLGLAGEAAAQRRTERSNEVTWKCVCMRQRGLSLDPGLLCTWHLTRGISENQHPLKCEYLVAVPATVFKLLPKTLKSAQSFRPLRPTHGVYVAHLAALCVVRAARWGWWCIVV